ncbi:MAG: LLM class flavin-dependent oxidoreductase [Blastocatellia bacterium]|nr:LLM class flavin-dependent oxidoreductase [Blastocatellia bacterium]
MMNRSLRFHWSLSQAGDKFRRSQATKEMSGLPSFEAQVDLCRRAEECGIDSMLMAIGFSRPDPLLLSTAIGMETSRIKFMVACRAGLISPAAFVQQINTLSTLIQGRVHINMVCGHTPHELRYYGDFLTHDERYDRTDEFLTVCRAFWNGREPVNFEGKYYRVEDGRLNTPFISDEREAPEIYLGGNSEKAAELAVTHASCLWRFADAPMRVRPAIAPVLEKGTEVGLLVALIARPTREESLRAAGSLIENFGAETKQVHREFARKSDSVAFTSTYKLAESAESAWLTPYLWTGAVPYLGAPAIALVGSFEDIATALMEYKEIGISQFLFLGWPDIEEMTFFGSGVLPLIRKQELSLYSAVSRQPSALSRQPSALSRQPSERKADS